MRGDYVVVRGCCATEVKHLHPSLKSLGVCCVAVPCRRMGTRMAATGVRRGIATWSQLTDEQKMLRDMCRTFADEELKPNAGMWDQKHMFPADAVKAMGEMGLLGVAQDDKYGGAGMDAMSYAIAVEEISRGCASAGVIMSAQNSLYCEPVG
jgi:butyryl-CoA dehydrogenase